MIAPLFNSIAKRYDFLNHFLSLYIDKIWRRKTIQELSYKKKIILDIATGTGDLAIETIKQNKAEHVIGIDISKGMLEQGQRKINKKDLHQRITLMEGNALEINFPNEKFDAVIIGFGVRNFSNLNRGLKEIYRVLKPQGELIILEFSKINNPVIAWVYKIYLNGILPNIGRVISCDKEAYTYLSQSINAFPSGLDFLDALKKIGFIHLEEKVLSFGIARIYKAKK